MLEYVLRMGLDLGVWKCVWWGRVLRFFFVGVGSLRVL